MYICVVTDLLDHLELAIPAGGQGVYRHDTWRLRGDHSPFARLYFVQAGSGYLRHHGREFILRPGWLYLIPAYSNLDLGTPRDVTIWWVHLQATLAGAAELFAVLPPPAYEIQAPATAEFAARFGQMAAATATARTPAPAIRLQLRGWLLATLALFYPAATNAESAEAATAAGAAWRRLEPVLAHVRRHLDRRVSVAELAAIAGLERAWFTTRFRRLTGLSPGAYMLRLRIEQAQIRLRDPARKLETIAHETGFHDAFHFSKAFKRLTGRCPREFRRRLAAPMP